jgi:hypothetical protein
VGCVWVCCVRVWKDVCVGVECVCVWGGGWRCVCGRMCMCALAERLGWHSSGMRCVCVCVCVLVGAGEVGGCVCRIRAKVGEGWPPCHIIQMDYHTDGSTEPPAIHTRDGERHHCHHNPRTCPWMSPQTVTGLRTGCTLHSSISISFTCRHRRVHGFYV